MNSSSVPGKAWDFAEPAEVGVDAEGLKAAMAALDEFTLDQGAGQAMVVRDGRVIWAGADIDNVHPVWSCSKSFTSMCLGLMIDEGRCGWDDPVARWAPFLEDRYPEMTIRQCAAFTAGYNQQKAEGKPDETANPFDPAEPIFEHGSHFHYSMATDLLGYAVTAMAGQSLRELFWSRIGQVIGMNPADFRWGDWNEFVTLDGVPVNGGSGCYAKGVWISARQMARVGWLAANHGRWGGRQLLSEAYFDQAVAPSTRPDTPPFDPAAWYLRLPGSYGLNWWINGVAHDGRRQWSFAPADAFALQGNNNNICFAIPSWRMVVVRLGTDGIINTDLYDKIFEPLAAALKA